MGPAEFIRKWERSTLKESAAAQQHFLDLCALLDEPTPADVDPTGETYCFEKGATKSTGGQGFADVWKRRHFGWEYKGPNKILDAAYRQLLTYSVALENPPLLIVSDTKQIIIRTNWTNTVQETHEIGLTDLLDGAKRDILKAAFSSPELLKPKKTRQQLTADAADEFSTIAQQLRDRGHDPHTVAHFVNRLVFCMFAEDVGLLPNKLFEKALARSARAPEKAQYYLQRLFAAMKDGGEFGLEDIPWFNGGLFDSDEALPLDADNVELAMNAARLDWADIDPSILGTLFERGLDPSKRSQLGAHYTDRDKIMMIVRPVIVEPLTKKWEQKKAEIEAELKKVTEANERITQIRADAAKALKFGAAMKDEKERQKATKTERGRATKAMAKANALYDSYLENLSSFRVLDPACGSGNFLYLSLLALKDQEHRANLDAEAFGLTRRPPRIGPEAVKGIEINPNAAELARVSIWVGEIQWMRRNGFYAKTNPILRSLGSIECRDALIEQDSGTGKWRESEWPDADVIVGNPPFLGNKRMITELGEGYVSQLRRIYSDNLTGGVDLVVYWFDKAWRQIKSNKMKRAGLVATNSIRAGANREILKQLAEKGCIYSAWSDEPWIVEGASVRVSIVCFQEQSDDRNWLNGLEVGQIFSDLSASDIDYTRVLKLRENNGVCFVGVILNGGFEIDPKSARRILKAPRNVNGRYNSDVLRPTLNGDDFNGERPDKWVVDFGTTMSAADAAFFEEPFHYIEQTVRPFRQRKKKDGTFAVRANNEREIWWRHARARPAMRRALQGLSRYIATPMVSSYRTFGFLDAAVLPDQKLVVFSRDDDFFLGILQSRMHEVWTVRTCSWIGAGNDITYSNTAVFLTFPFPEGLTPDTPVSDCINDPRAIRVADAAARLNELRDNWLFPPDHIKREAEVVESFPDRILPVDEKAEKILKTRTLTNLYNERPPWLGNVHRALDEAVAAAYGWEEDLKMGKLTDEEILKRLFELNQERAKTPPHS
jgi:type II restriction/modification system DNA methylase subunit YeeA